MNNKGKQCLWRVAFFCIALLSSLKAEEFTQGDKELQAIVAKHKQLEMDVAQAPEVDAADLQRRLQDIVLGYELFLTENPGNTYAYVLYGKLLVQLDEHERAYQAFLHIDRIDPNIAVVKQQLGNYLAEEGEYVGALAYFLRAVELSPETAVYHYQLGELLETYRRVFIHEQIFTQETLEAHMLEAFKEAARLAPQERDLQYRLAQAYYDLRDPNWKEALAQWDVLLAEAEYGVEIDTIRIHRARILLELFRPEEAKQELNRIFSPELEKERRDLLQYIEKC